MPRGKRCIAHRHEYVTSEEHHHLQPQSRGGLTRADNMVWLCSNAHGDVHYFLDLIEKCRNPGLIPGSIAKHFGPAIRQTAIRGWLKYADAFMAGTYDAHALLWSSSGQPREDLVYRIPYATAVESGNAQAMLNHARLILMGHADLAGPL